MGTDMLLEMWLLDFRVGKPDHAVRSVADEYPSKAMLRT